MYALLLENLTFCHNVSGRLLRFAIEVCMKQKEMREMYLQLRQKHCKCVQALSVVACFLFAIFNTTACSHIENCVVRTSSLVGAKSWL